MVRGGGMECSTHSHQFPVPPPYLGQLAVRATEASKAALQEEVNLALLGTCGEVKGGEACGLLITAAPGKGEHHHRQLRTAAEGSQEGQVHTSVLGKCEGTEVEPLKQWGPKQGLVKDSQAGRRSKLQCSPGDGEEVSDDKCEAC